MLFRSKSSSFVIIDVLKKEDISVSSAYVHGVLKDAGIGKLARRSLDPEFPTAEIDMTL